MIIFDEEKYVTNLLNNNISISNKNKRDLQLISIYFRNLGNSEKEIYNKLDNFCKFKIINYNSDTSYKTLYKIIENSKNKKLKRSYNINITENEIKLIKEEYSLKVQKLMFVYLVLAKYYMSNNLTDKYYVGTSDVDIFKLCKMYTRKSEKLEFMHYLTQKGYITPTLTMSSIINYVDENSKVILSFVPDEDMEYMFEKINGVKFIKCNRCNKMVKKRNNKQKYCNECSKLVKYEKSHKSQNGKIEN